MALINISNVTFRELSGVPWYKVKVGRRRGCEVPHTLG